MQVEGPMRVEALWRYPVKSMAGERLSICDLAPAGVVGDRAYALIDEQTDRVVSAKRPSRYAGVLEWQPTFTAPVALGRTPPVRIQVGDDEVSSADPDAAASLSELLGRTVRLAGAVPDGGVYEILYPDDAGEVAPEAFLAASRIEPAERGGLLAALPIGLLSPGTFFDVAPVHIITTGTLARLADAAPGSHFDARRFRPNLVIHADAEEEYPELSLLGAELAGAYAEVLASGPVREGDRVELLGSR